MVHINSNLETNNGEIGKNNSYDSRTKVGIIGFGVVGSATGKGLQEMGNRVFFYDTNAEVRDRYREEFEVFDDQYDLTKTEVTMLALPTPTVPLAYGGRLNASLLEKAAEELGKQLKTHDRYHVFINRSTVLPGTTRHLGRIIEEASGKKLGKDFGLVMNPEFLRAFNNEEDFRNPRLTVIGEYDSESGMAAEIVYQRVGPTIRKTTLESAEMIKYANNIFNGVKISYFNELNRACERLEIDSREVAETIQRTAEGLWNPDYGTHGGLPYGGSCIPKDTDSFVTFCHEKGIPARMLEATILTNEDEIVRERVNAENGKANAAETDKYFAERFHTSYDNVKIVRKDDSQNSHQNGHQNGQQTKLINQPLEARQR